MIFPSERGDAFRSIAYQMQCRPCGLKLDYKSWAQAWELGHQPRKEERQVKVRKTNCSMTFVDLVKWNLVSGGIVRCTHKQTNFGGWLCCIAPRSEVSVWPQANTKTQSPAFSYHGLARQASEITPLEALDHLCPCQHGGPAHVYNVDYISIVSSYFGKLKVPYRCKLSGRGYLCSRSGQNGQT